MNEYIRAILTGLVVSGISSIAIWILTLKHKKDKLEWERKIDDSYTRGKDDASEMLRTTYDQIEEDKNKLDALTDRELLVQIMMALGTYGRRMDRIDGKLKCIANYQAYIDDMNDRTQKLSHSFAVLDGYISSTASVLGGLRQMVQDTSGDIHSLITAMGDMGDLHSKVDHHVAELNKAELILEFLEEKVSGVVNDMNTVMTVCDQAPMKKLKDIEDTLVTFSDTLKEMKGALGDISHKANSMEKAIETSLTEYGFGSVYSKIAELADALSDLDDDLCSVRRKVEETYDEVGSVKSKASDIQSTVDNSLSTYGYDSLHSKLDDISSGVSSIRYKVDA